MGVMVRNNSVVSGRIVSGGKMMLVSDVSMESITDEEGEGVKILSEAVISELGIGIRSDGLTVETNIENSGVMAGSVTKAEVPNRLVEGMAELEIWLVNWLVNERIEEEKIAMEVVKEEAFGDEDSECVRMGSCVDVGKIISGDVTETDGSGDGVKMLTETVNSEVDMGISILFEDVSISELKTAVVSGTAIIDVER